MNAILLASAGLAILLVGGGVGFWAGRSGVGGSKARVEKAEAELDEYKRSVTEHFGQTAAHFQAIGKQYRELYEHMATGEQALCEPDETGQQLLFAPGAVAASTDLTEPAVEAIVGEDVGPPIDYAERPIATESTDAPEAPEEPADELTAKTDADAESVDTGVADESVSETTAEPQQESEAEVEERTLH